MCKPKYYIRVQIAGIKIEICFRSKTDFLPCVDYLADFAEPDFRVFATSEELDKAYQAVRKQYNVDDLVEIAGIESRIIHRKIADNLLNYDTILVHGSVVAIDGKSYMFTAPSGIGKSTRTKLWLNEYPRSIVVNGDKPFIRIMDKYALAYGSPWCGKEGWGTNTAIPLHAILLLERGDKDSIKEISLGEAFPKLLQQTYIPKQKEASMKSLSLLRALQGKTRFYQLTSTPTADSIRLVHDTVHS